MSLAVFRSGVNCPMLDPHWWEDASQSGMLSVNLEPIRVHDAPTSLLDHMSDCIISEAMSRCIANPHIVIFGSYNARKLAAVTDSMRAWRPQCSISRCEQPTAAVHRRSCWRPTIDMLSSLSTLFGTSELDSPIIDQSSGSSSVPAVRGADSSQRQRGDANESYQSDEYLLELTADDVRIAAEDDAGYISE